MHTPAFPTTDTCAALKVEHDLRYLLDANRREVPETKKAARRGAEEDVVLPKGSRALG